jgi:hypothetical protein
VIEEDRETKIKVLMKVGLKRKILDKLSDDKINALFSVLNGFANES